MREGTRVPGAPYIYCRKRHLEPNPGPPRKRFWRCVFETYCGHAASNANPGRPRKCPRPLIALCKETATFRPDVPHPGLRPRYAPGGSGPGPGPLRLPIWCFGDFYHPPESRARCSAAANMVFRRFPPLPGRIRPRAQCRPGPGAMRPPIWCFDDSYHPRGGHATSGANPGRPQKCPRPLIALCKQTATFRPDVPHPERRSRHAPGGSGPGPGPLRLPIWCFGDFYHPPESQAWCHAAANCVFR